LAGAVRNTIRSETARRIVITAIALKRFQLKHAHLPETLAALVLAFIPSVPIDPEAGRPLCYRRNADGTFLLYSVGEDGKDDGGDATHTSSSGSSSLAWQHVQARDWVWPQPATEAEIKLYLDKLDQDARDPATGLLLHPPQPVTAPVQPAGTN